MADLVDIDAAKAYVGFNAAADDADLMDAAHAAGNRAVIDFLEWNPILATTTEVVDGYGGPSVALKRAPIVEVISVKISGSLVPLTSLAVQNRMLLLKQGVFPLVKASIEVVYRAGYKPLPAPVVQATKIAIKAVWTASGFDPNFASHSIAGVESASFSRDGPGSLPPAARSMLQPYRRVF